jgi:hypothetical protein
MVHTEGVALGHNRATPKRPVDIDLIFDLIEPFRSGAGNVSAHDEARTKRAIDAFSALYHEHGSLSEEMQLL